MKTIKYQLLIVLLFAAALTAHAQSTAFTYPGRLAGSGAPYTGFAEMQFALFSSPTGGVALATSTPAITGVNVSAGQFTTTLDFGAAAFSGADRFLEIQVRTNTGAFTTLTPRQPLTPTPYALYARTAGTALGPWSLNFGDNLSYSGNVGIGTTTPQARLDVRGEIRLGTNGQYRAAAGEENLRIIRGTVDFNGTKLAGQGFTVTHISEGDYLITFSTPFLSVPSVTATADDSIESHDILDFIVASVFSPSTTSSVRVRTRVHSDTITTGPLDFKFHFIAFGPR